LTFRFWPLIPLALLLAGCSQPAPLSSLSASSTTVSAQGGQVTLSWSGGSAPYLLSIISSSGSTAGITVGGKSYSGPMSVTGNQVQVSLPANTASSNTVYTFILSASGLSASLQVSVAGVNSLTAFTASSTTVGTQGGTITIGWQGSTSPTLTISSSGSTSGITVNGVPYSGPTILSGSFAVLSFPPTSQYGGAPTYTLSLAAGGVTKTLSLIQEVAPILAVANEGNSTVTIYALSGITSSSGPALTLNTGSVTSPTALAFDQEGNLWVGGATCPSILLEFQAPLTLNETPKTFNAGSNAYSLAFDAQGNLWVGGNSCQNGGGTIQEEKMTSSGLSQVTSLSPGATPLGLAFDQQGDLWVGLVGNGSTQILEYQTPLSSSSTPKTYPLQSNSGGFGPIAFDTSGNLYSFVQSNPAPLEELPAGSSSFTQLFSVTTPGILFLPTSLAFDQEGNLWVSDLNSKLALIQVLSGLCAGST